MKKRFLLYISLLLNVAFIIAVYFQLDTYELYLFINSDTLYLPLLFRDIVIDHAKDIYWYLPPATCFFPDAAIYFIVSFFIKNFILAKLITGIVLCVLMLVGFWLFLNESVIKISPLYLSIGTNLILLFHIAYLSTKEFFFTFYLTATNYHLGAFVVSLYCLFLAVLYLKNKKIWPLIILLLLYILTFSSDFLTICHLTVPLISLIILLILKRSYRLQAIYLFAVSCLGLISGYWLYQLIEKSSHFNITSMQDLTYLNFNFQNIDKAYSLMLNYHFMFIKAMDVRMIIFVFCIISLVSSMVILIRKLWKYLKGNEIAKDELLELAYLLLIVSQVVVLYIAPVITGIYKGTDQLRYNVYVFYVLIMNYSYLSYKWLLRYGFQKYSYPFSIAIVIFFSIFCIRTLIKTNIKRGSDNLFGHYPDYVKKVDEICQQHNLKYGLADFWLAKPITMLSKSDLRVYQTYFDGCPYPHVVNLNWFYGTEDRKTPPPEFEFIMMNNLNDSLVYKKLENHIIDTLINDDIILVKVRPFIFTRETWSVMTFIDKP
ncbi:MAG: hypothetical protein JW973_00680 [Bacteroidales bacterium]|nr:hypothetical protein [Bacteroidales bacterium]